jgi:integrase
VAEITADTLAAAAAVLLTARAPATVNKIVRHVRAVLRQACEDLLVAEVPPWRKLREPTHCPLAFTSDEFSRLLRAAAGEPGTIAGLPAGPWWTSLLRSIWFSGARIGAMLGVTRADVLPERSGFYCRAERQKRHADQFFPVDEAAAATWRRIYNPPREYFWPTDFVRITLYRRFGQMLCRAGLDAPTRKRFHRIRCSCASYLKRNGGNPTEQLGHSSPAVTRAYYDPRITGESTIFRFLPTLG